MKVRDVIKKLQKYNFDADFRVIYKSKDVPFLIKCNSSDNASEEECEEVCFTVIENYEV